MGLVKCSKCGTEINERDIKCNNCGAINFGFNPIEPKEENSNVFEEVTVNLETELNTSSITIEEIDGNIEEIPDNKEENIKEEYELKEDLIPNNEENINNEPIIPFVQEQELNNNTEVKEETKTPQLEDDNKNIIQNTNNKKEATIKCSNCGDLVSKKAKKCPNCGNKLKSNKLLIIAIIIFFILLLAIIMFIIGSNDSLDVNKKHDNNIESGGTTILENKDETEEPPQTNQEESQTEITPEFEENIESEVTTEQAPVPTPEPAPAPVAPPAPVCNESAKQQLTNEYQTTIQQRDAEYNANYLDAQQKVEKAKQLLELAGGYLSQSDFNEQYSQATSDVQKQLLESRYNMSKNYDGMVDSFNQLPTAYNNWKDTYTKWYQQELQNLGC